MKISNLKPCALCGGPLLEPAAGNWYVVRVSLAMVNPSAANQVMGLSQIFGGNLAMAEAFAPRADCVVVAGDKDPRLMTELHLCLRCYCGIGKYSQRRDTRSRWRRAWDALCGVTLPPAPSGVSLAEAVEAAGEDREAAP